VAATGLLDFQIRVHSHAVSWSNVAVLAIIISKICGFGNKVNVFLKKLQNSSAGVREKDVLLEEGCQK
jgi:hypothetical protein